MAEEGDTITVVYAEQVFSPVQYNSFRLGPLSMTTRVREGETPEEAFKRAWDFLDKMARQSFLATRRDFMERMNWREP